VDIEAAIFLAFYGIEIIEKGNSDKLEISPLTNPTMLMTLEALGVEREDSIDEVEIGGAAVILNFVREDAITLSF